MGSSNIESREVLLAAKKKYEELIKDPKEKLWHPNFRKSLKFVNERLKELDKRGNS